MVHVHTSPKVSWRDQQLSEIIFKEEKKGRNFNGVITKIKFAYSVCSTLHNESGLCLEVSGLLGISQRCGVS